MARPLTQLQRRVLLQLANSLGSLTTAQLAERLEVAPGLALRAITALQKRDLAYRVNTHWWNPTATGLRRAQEL